MHAKLWLVPLLSLFLLPGCSSGSDRPGVGSSPAVESIYTDLTAASCRKEIDKSDPNETPYLQCPGVGGYSLIVRRVDSGRQSIEIVDSEKRTLRLNYHEVVTRHMSSLGDKAEWRIATEGGRQLPIALIVRILAREDLENPDRVSVTYLAVAKITPGAACVTDRLTAGGQSEVEVRRVADTARDRACAPPQPRLVVSHDR